MKSLESKIVFSFSLISFTFLAMTIVTLIQINRVTESSRLIQNSLQPALEANLKMTNAINTTLVSLQNWILLEEDKFVRQRQAFWSVIDKSYHQLLNYWHDSEEEPRLSQLEQGLALFRKQQDQIEIMVSEGRTIEAIQLFKKDTLPLGNSLLATLKRISDPQSWQMHRAFLQEEKQESFMKNVTVAFMSLSIFGSIFIGLLLIRAVIIPLNRTMRLADAIAVGDYSIENKEFSGQDKLDIALKAMITRLEKKRQENQTQQTQLQRYNKELEASNEELSQFAYRTSHDLKAPLITVRGLAEFIREDITAGDYQEAEKNAGMIANHVRKLENLVVDILNLAKAELQDIEHEEIEVSTLVNDIIDRLTEVYLNNEVIIENQIELDVKLFTSKVRLSQILENLISNAIKYSDVNKPAQYVSVSLKCEGDKAVFIIEDNGLGIPEEFKTRVFEMFQRFHPEVAYGSGLGLYIIRKHIEKLKGNISFSSSKSGTRFLIALPIFS